MSICKQINQTPQNIYPKIYMQGYRSLYSRGKILYKS